MKPWFLSLEHDKALRSRTRLPVSSSQQPHGEGVPTTIAPRGLVLTNARDLFVDSAAWPL